MKITDINVWLCETNVKGNVADSTRNVETIGFTVVRVSTDSGLEGIGVTYHEVGGEATKAFIECSLKPLMVGKDPMETEALYEEVIPYMRGVGRKGLAFCAYSAVDIALWDIKGKALGLPLYKLLGGRRNIVPIYASGGWTSYSKEELVAEAMDMVGRGYKKIKLKVGVDKGQNPSEDLRRIAAVREAVGPEIGIMLDANNVWRAATAVQFANRVKEYDIEFFEEPVFADDLPGLAQFKRGTDVPLATGEHEYTRYGFRDLILNQSADIIQGDVTRCGGFSESLKIIHLAQTFNLGYAPHGMEHMHMHLVAAAPNGLYLERLLIFEELASKVYKNAPEPENGFMKLPDLLGLGLELNMDFLGELK